MHKNTRSIMFRLAPDDFDMIAGLVGNLRLRHGRQAPRIFADSLLSTFLEDLPERLYHPPTQSTRASFEVDPETHDLAVERADAPFSVISYNAGERFCSNTRFQKQVWKRVAAILSIDAPMSVYLTDRPVAKQSTNKVG